LNQYCPGTRKEKQTSRGRNFEQNLVVFQRPDRIVLVKDKLVITGLVKGGKHGGRRHNDIERVVDTVNNNNLPLDGVKYEAAGLSTLYQVLRSELK
jgi:hypothetical protein